MNPALLAYGIAIGHPEIMAFAPPQIPHEPEPRRHKRKRGEPEHSGPLLTAVDWPKAWRLVNVGCK